MLGHCRSCDYHPFSLLLVCHSTRRLVLVYEGDVWMWWSPPTNVSALLSRPPVLLMLLVRLGWSFQYLIQSGLCSSFTRCCRLVWSWPCCLPDPRPPCPSLSC